jgi:hypothetical protein
MMSDKQKSDYLVNKLLCDIEFESMEQWVQTSCMNNPDIHKEPTFRDELRRRLVRFHELQVLAEAYELIERIDCRFRDQFTSDNTENL